jgi:hypothetical protein
LLLFGTSTVSQFTKHQTSPEASSQELPDAVLLNLQRSIVSRDKASKMSLLKLFQLRGMTLHQWRFTAQTRIPPVAVLGLLPRIDGYAHFSSGTPTRAGLPHFERIAIRHESIPASKYLAGTILTPDPTRVVSY